MSTARAIVSSTLVQLFGKGATALLSLIVVKMLTGYLTTTEYGYYGTVYSLLAVFGIFADLGLYTIALAEMAKDKDNVPKILGNIMSIRTIVAVTTCALAILASFLIPAYQGTFIPLSVCIASISVILALLNGTLTSVLQVYYKMGYSVFATIASKAMNVLVMIAVIYGLFPKESNDFVTQGSAFYGLIFAGILGNSVLLLITYFYTRKYSPVSFRFDFSYWKYILKTTLPYGIALVLATLYFRMDVFMISLMKEGQDVGLYEVIVKVLEVLSVISLFFLNSLLPVLSRHIKEKSERLSDLIQYSLNFLYALGAPIVVGGFLMAYQLVYLIADKKYLTGYDGLAYGSDYVMKVLVFAICLSFVNSLFGYLLVASGRQTKLLWINATCLAFNMLTNLYIIPQWSYVGAAYTTVASELLVLILTYSVARHYLGFRTRIFPLLQVTASALGMGVIIYFLRDPLIGVLQNKAILLIIPLAGLIYAGMLFATGVINKDILALLRKKEHTVTLEENA